MGQTIICEYLATWAETGIAPDPTAFGFDGLYSMLEECQDVMLSLGTAVNDGKRRCVELETVLNGLAADKQRNEAAQYRRIKELEAQVTKLNQQIADDASVNAEIDKRLKAHDDAMTAKDEIIDGLKAQVKAQDSTINQLVNIIQSHANHITELESQLAAITEQLSESDEANESLERQLADTQKAAKRLLIEQELDAMEEWS
jgi:chromosome segregation ATPase